MIVGMALVAMRGAVAVAMIVMTMAVMVVVMTAATALAMRMLVLVIMLVFAAVRMIMAVMVVMMAVVMTMMMMIVPAAAIVAMGVMMDLRLRLERTLDHRHRTALPAHQFAERGIVRDVEGIGRHLGWDMVSPEMPGETNQTQRVLGADLQQAFRCGLDLDQRAVFQPQGVAVVQHRGLVERDRELKSARRADADAIDRTVPMAQWQRIDDALGLDGGLAENGGGAKHRRRSHGLRPGTTRPSPDRILVAQTGGRATKPGCHRGLSAAAP